jgi:GNAT superfamily N-acetyltransferase
LFFVEPDMRGTALGHILLKACLAHARAMGAARITLWTHESHTAACCLYAKTGFRLTTSTPVHNFDVDLVEQQWEIALR